VGPSRNQRDGDATSLGLDHVAAQGMGSNSSPFMAFSRSAFAVQLACIVDQASAWSPELAYQQRDDTTTRFLRFSSAPVAARSAGVYIGKSRKRPKASIPANGLLESGPAIGPRAREPKNYDVGSSANTSPDRETCRCSVTRSDEDGHYYFAWCYDRFDRQICDCHPPHTASRRAFKRRAFPSRATQAARPPARSAGAGIRKSPASGQAAGTPRDRSG
jgi:hypothetical protein